jgi:hypothetical protein
MIVPAGSRVEQEGPHGTMTAVYPKRLIEVDLPIDRILGYARWEKSIRHGRVSTLPTGGKDTIIMDRHRLGEFWLNRQPHFRGFAAVGGGAGRLQGGFEPRLSKPLFQPFLR